MSLKNIAIIIILILPILPNLWSIWHAFQSDFPSYGKKVTWMLLAIFVPFFGGILYILLGRKSATRVI